MFNFVKFLKTIPPYSYGICLLGMISGMTFNLISFTIPYNLAEAKYSSTFVGLIFLTSLPYCLKPILAPFIDKYSIPFLCKGLGHRRGWAIAIQVCLLISISVFLIIEPTYNPLITIIVMPVISLCAALQDIVLDAYRIEHAKTEQDLSLISTFSITGFRIGMLIGSAGGLYISNILNWHYVYLCAFVVILLGPIIILHVTEPRILKRKTATSLLSSTEYLQVIKDSFRLLKIKNPKWFLIILFILLYKSSDTVPAAMSSLVLIDLSFTTTEIAGISKAYGLLLMIMGGAIAGIITAKVGIVKSVFICGIFQLMSPLMFAILSIMGNNILIMFLTITLQNFTSGLGGTALVIYFSILCDKQLVATQFSIISSFSSFSRILLSFSSGVAASYLDWTTFFIFNILISAMFIPIFLLIYNLTVYKKVENS